MIGRLKSFLITFWVQEPGAVHSDHVMGRGCSCFCVPAFWDSTAAGRAIKRRANFICKGFSEFINVYFII